MTEADAGTTIDWAGVLATLKDADAAFEQLIDPTDPYLRLQGLRSIMMSLAHSYYTLMSCDPERPFFHPHYNNVIVAGGPNADFNYYFAYIDSGGAYRISGTRGTSRMLSIITGALLQSGNLTRGPSFAAYDVDTLHLGPGGSFDVVLSQERPEDWAGDWWYLDPRTTEIFARQVNCDWENEVNGAFAIERIDVPASGNRWPAERLEHLLDLLAHFPGRYLPVILGHARELRDAGHVNSVKPNRFADAGGFPNQVYYEGIFEFSPGEALIVETELPERARYWSIQLTDLLFNALDWMNCQCGLNDHQARIDADGRVRVVLSVDDPGVPNWIDTVGLYRGILFGRWNECSSYPMPTITRVPLGDLRDHLPPGTPWVSPAERQQQLRARRRAAQLRRKW